MKLHHIIFSYLKETLNRLVLFLIPGTLRFVSLKILINNNISNITAVYIIKTHLAADIKYAVVRTKQLIHALPGC